ncbi:response regulator [Granulicella sp. WH15]|uniref:response regulator n=1 Tax=Granulicella sp. WH15 TaxID=2602070 RepID=UPI0013669C0C|nr:response regulator [Granulicella sp. WH15]QHN05007.1 response regulator [Granulicella sp. WH15]
MTSEQNVPEVQVHQGPPQGVPGAGEHNSSTQGEDGQSHGMGHSKSSRRRRRKRKGKTGEGAGDQQHEAGSETPNLFSASEGVIPSVQANGNSSAPQSQPQPQQGRSFQANGGQQQNGFGQNGAAPGGTKRWKKKFRDRDRPRQSENPGNQANGNGGSGYPQQQNSGGYRDKDTHQPGNNAGFKRKGGFGAGGGKQQRSAPRGFVGPMDHSYRVVNGNFLDAPPSTIEHGNGNFGGRSRGGYQSDSQPIDYSQGRTIPIPPDAPTRIVFFIEDLFFQAKIQETARKLGVKVAFLKNDKESIAALTGSEEEDRPGLIVFDLNNANAKPLTLIPKLKTKLKKSTSIVGFLSHLQGDLKAKAVEAGCDTVMPRAAFSQNLPNLLRRYGIEEVEDTSNFNQ